MPERRRRINRGTLPDRFATLRERQTRHARQLEALERRERADLSRLHAVRSRNSAVVRVDRETIVKRRSEYVELATVAPSPAPPRVALATLVAAFVVPMLIALISGIVGTHTAIVARRATGHNAPALATLLQSIETKKRIAGVLTAFGESGVRSQTMAPLPKSVTRIARAARSAPPRPVLASAQQTSHNAPAPAPNAASTIVAPIAAPRFVRAAPIVHEATTSRSIAHAAVPPRPAEQRHNAAVPQRVALAPLPRATPRSQGPWRLTPDGTWVTTVRAPADAGGAQFDASTGQLIALERSPLEGEGAIVTIGWARPVSVSINAGGQSRTVDLSAPDDTLDAFAATASAVGPHLINLGWTPLSPDSDVVDYKVYRTQGDGEPQLVAQLSAAKHSWSDTDVASGSSYGYDVVADTSSGAVEANSQTVSAPQELPAVPASALEGKGMFLYFSSIPADERYYGRYHPEAVIAEAKRAGIHVIEVRMARGSCIMAQTSASRVWLDRLIDSAAQSGIHLVAWTVPRRVTTQDLQQTLAAASYRTPAGNGFVGVALDLETGERYMGDGHKAVAAMVRYISIVRQAAGSHYLIVATVASPEMGNHTNADYPYARIAAYADVLQPMEYWHYFEQSSHHEYARREVAGASAAAVARTRALAGRDIPVNVAGQSVALEGTGSPSGREIQWSLGGAKSAGGIGETFFDWAGTGPDAWAAIQAFDW